MRNHLRLGHIRYHELEIADLEIQMKYSKDKEKQLKRIEYHEEQIRLLKGEKNDD